MRFTWDPAKSDATLARGFDFELASLIFNGFVAEVEDRRRDYGERRMIATGMVGGGMFTVVYTDRETENGVERRIISAWRANRRERKTYEQRRAGR